MTFRRKTFQPNFLSIFSLLSNLSGKLKKKFLSEMSLAVTSLLQYTWPKRHFVRKVTMAKTSWAEMSLSQMSLARKYSGQNVFVPNVESPCIELQNIVKFCRANRNSMKSCRVLKNLCKVAEYCGML